MTLGEALGLSDTQERRLVRILQAGLFGLVVYGFVTLKIGIILNGVVSLAITFVPALLRREYNYYMDAGLVLWLTIAVGLHAVGSLGIYEQYPMYDVLTHTISSTVVAGIGYAGLLAFESHSDALDVPSAFRGVFVVLFVVAFGVFWEILEFGAVVASEGLGVESPLIVFGIDDIVTDYIFNTVGGLAVALWGSKYIGGLVGFFRSRLQSASSNRS